MGYCSNSFSCPHRGERRSDGGDCHRVTSKVHAWRGAGGSEDSGTTTNSTTNSGETSETTADAVKHNTCTAAPTTSDKDTMSFFFRLTPYLFSPHHHTLFF